MNACQAVACRKPGRKTRTLWMGDVELFLLLCDRHDRDLGLAEGEADQ